MIFNELYEMMKNPSKESLDMSLANCHIDGVFSLVVGGNEHGKLTRVFIATKKIKPFDIQFHTHRYNLRIGVIHGNFTHHTALEGFTSDLYSGEAVSLKSYEYKSPLNGGTGLVGTGESCYILKTSDIPIGGELYLPYDLLHTVSCAKGTIWVVQELGFEDDSSTVLGVDFTTDGLYTEPKQFQVNDMFQTVLGKLKKLV